MAVLVYSLPPLARRGCSLGRNGTLTRPLQDPAPPAHSVAGHAAPSDQQSGAGAGSSILQQEVDPPCSGPEVQQGGQVLGNQRLWLPAWLTEATVAAWGVALGSQGVLSAAMNRVYASLGGVPPLPAPSFASLSTPTPFLEQHLPPLQLERGLPPGDARSVAPDSQGWRTPAEQGRSPSEWFPSTIDGCRGIFEQL